MHIWYNNATMIKSKNHQQQDLSKILKRKHEGKWVAISYDYKKIVGYSDNLQKLTKEIRDKNVIYLKALSSSVRYAFEVTN